MNDEHTPTTEQVRSAYAHDPEAEYRDLVGFPAMQRENLRCFDRWLAAHDAEVLHRAALFLRGSENPRQSDNSMQSVRYSMDDAGYELLQLSKRAADGPGVVAEEPEWEYGATGWDPAKVPSLRESLDGALDSQRYWIDVVGAPSRLMKRTPGRKPGPWVPVKQEGAGREGDA